MFYQSCPSGCRLPAVADDIQVVNSPCKRHIQQIEIIHHVLTLLDVIVVGIYRLLQLLFVIHSEERQLVVGLCLRTAPQLVAAEFVGPVAEGDDHIVKLQSLAFMYGNDAYSVLLSHTDSLS